jgi:hypothetical protein
MSFLNKSTLSEVQPVNIFSQALYFDVLPIHLFLHLLPVYFGSKQQEQNIIPHPEHCCIVLSNLFSSSSFNISRLIFKSLIHLEFVFAFDVQ